MEPPSDPLGTSRAAPLVVRRQIRNQREQRRRTDPFGASGTMFEAVPGPAQFKLRMPQAILHITHGGVRIE
eukprot:15460944-Alexandrium_andersonii.AAC.1